MEGEEQVAGPKTSSNAGEGDWYIDAMGESDVPPSRQATYGKYFNAEDEVIEE